MAEEASPDMVLVIVGRQGADNRHAVLLRHVEQARDIPGRIDDDGLAARQTSNQIREVGHFSHWDLAEVEIGLFGHRVCL